jgi:hypothetical protein
VSLRFRCGALTNVSNRWVSLLQAIVICIAWWLVKQCHSKLDNWGEFIYSYIHIFVFCVINFFSNRLFLWSVNTNIWIWRPPSQLSSLLQHCKNFAKNDTFSSLIFNLHYEIHIFLGWLRKLVFPGMKLRLYLSQIRNLSSNQSKRKAR